MFINCRVANKGLKKTTLGLDIFDLFFLIYKIRTAASFSRSGEYLNDVVVL